MGSFTVQLPLGSKSGNWWAREGRFSKARKAHSEKLIAWLWVRNRMRAVFSSRVLPRAHITLTSHRRVLADDDNLVTGLKHFRDGVALALAGRASYDVAPDGVRSKYRFSCDQKKLGCGRDAYVTVTVTWRDNGRRSGPTAST
jgi:hypothetical protein